MKMKGPSGCNLFDEQINQLLRALSNGFLACVQYIVRVFRYLVR